MPANNKSILVQEWAKRIPGKVQHLWSPVIKRKDLYIPTITVYPHIEYVLDNARYSCWTRKVKWSSHIFMATVSKAASLPRPPRWVVVPDCPGDGQATLEEWKKWEPKLRPYKIPLAFVVQNGIKVKQIPESAEVIFVGGSDEWRLPRLSNFVATGKPVHVGRVNHFKRLWQCFDAGVQSCDGSGWFRGDPKQTQILLNYWEFLEGTRERNDANQGSLF